MHAARDVEAGVSIGLDQHKLQRKVKEHPFSCPPYIASAFLQIIADGVSLLGGHPALVVLFIYLLKQFKFLFSKELNCQLTQRGNSCTTQPSVSEVHT